MLRWKDSYLAGPEIVKHGTNAFAVKFVIRSLVAAVFMLGLIPLAWFGSQALHEATTASMNNQFGGGMGDIGSKPAAPLVLGGGLTPTPPVTVTLTVEVAPTPLGRPILP